MTHDNIILMGRVRQITSGNELMRARFKTPCRHKKPPERQSLGNLIIHDQPSTTNIKLLKTTSFTEEHRLNGEYRFSFTAGGGTKNFKTILIVFNPTAKTITITKTRAGIDPRDSDYHRIDLNPSNTKATAGTIARRIEDLLEDSSDAVKLAQRPKPKRAAA